MQDLYDFAEALGVTIEWARLKNRNGEYRHDLRRIRLRYGMTERLVRWTLAHELGHAVFADQPSHFGPANAKMERRASEWAALRLVDLDAYREAELLRDGHLPSMAHDLGVAKECLEVYQSLLSRLGGVTYLDPKMGAGQWAYQLDASYS